LLKEKPLKPEAPFYHPRSDTQIAPEFIRFFLKQTFVSPETYPVWKSSFTSVINELHVNEFEQLDLLVGDKLQ